MNMKKIISAVATELRAKNNQMIILLMMVLIAGFLLWDEVFEEQEYPEAVSMREGANAEITSQLTPTMPPITKEFLLKLVRTRKSPRANCSKLFHRDAHEIFRVNKNSRKASVASIPDMYYIKWAQKCEEFKDFRGYIKLPLSKEEAEFPLAYSIDVGRNIEQFDRLLQAIYMPQNYYCLYMEEQVKPAFRLAIKSIAKCFKNIYVSLRQIDKTEHFSTIDADLRCMKYLRRKKRWKYFINLSWEDYPLKTNLEMVKILKAVNGSVLIEGNTNR